MLKGVENDRFPFVCCPSSWIQGLAKNHNYEKREIGDHDSVINGTIKAARGLQDLPDTRWEERIGIWEILVEC